VFDSADGFGVNRRPLVREAVFAFLKGFSEGTRDFGCVADVFSIESDQPEEVHDLFVVLWLGEIQDGSDLFWIGSAAAYSYDVAQDSEAMIVEVALAEREDHGCFPGPFKE
jgi:hypothetical protein